MISQCSGLMNDTEPTTNGISRPFVDSVRNGSDTPGNCTDALDLFLRFITLDLAFCLEGNFSQIGICGSLLALSARFVGDLTCSRRWASIDFIMSFSARGLVSLTVHFSLSCLVDR